MAQTIIVGLVTVTLLITHFGQYGLCASAWKRMNSSEYKIVWKYASHENATQSCREENAELTSICSLEEEQQLLKWIHEINPKKDRFDIWIGYECNGNTTYCSSESNWRWADGKSCSYKNWHKAIVRNPTEPTYGDNRARIWNKNDANITRWVGATDSTYLDGCVCKKVHQGPCSTSSVNKCWNSSYYTIVWQNMTYPNATVYCQQQNAKLASICSKEEDEMLIQWLTAEKKKFDLWIGYECNISKTQCKNVKGWTWIDGQQCNYNNWHRINDEPTKGDKNARMRRSDAAQEAKWFGGGKEVRYDGYICKREAVSSTTVQVQKTISINAAQSNNPYITVQAQDGSSSQETETSTNTSGNPRPTREIKRSGIIAAWLLVTIIVIILVCVFIIWKRKKSTEDVYANERVTESSSVSRLFDAFKRIICCGGRPCCHFCCSRIRWHKRILVEDPGRKDLPDLIMLQEMKPSKRKKMGPKNGQDEEESKVLGQEMHFASARSGKDQHMRGQSQNIRGIHPCIRGQPMRGMHPNRRGQLQNMRGINPNMRGQPQNTRGINPNMRGQPPNMRGMNLNMRGQLQNTRGINPNMRGQPQNMRGMNPNTRGQPQNIRGMHPNMRGQPQNTRGINPNMRGQPQNMRGMNPNMRGQSQNMRGVHQNLRGRPGPPGSQSNNNLTMQPEDPTLKVNQSMAQIQRKSNHPKPPKLNLMKQPEDSCYKCTLDDMKNKVSTLLEEATIVAQYKSIGFDVHPSLPMTAGKDPKNVKKNRFQNVFPYDYNRVKLLGKEEDYINASYVDAGRPRAFIASQGPKAEGLFDFWHMIWQEKVNTIVMVTGLVENKQRKCNQYWPDEMKVAKFGEIFVKCISSANKKDATTRCFMAKKGNAMRKILQFHFHAWPDQGVPLFPNYLLNFWAKCKGAMKASRFPVVVHCSAGVGRTGTFIALDILLDEMQTFKAVDVHRCVTNLRKHRPFMVQNIEQYKFLYRALQAWVTVGLSLMNCQNFHQMFPTLFQTKEKGQAKAVTQFQYINETRRNQTPVKNPVATSNENVNRNRFPHILPDPEYSVKLKAREEDKYNYINAIFVDGYFWPNAFIVTQAPMEGTKLDFWKMVLENSCSVVVSLVSTAKLKVEEIYFPENKGDSLNMGPFTISCKSKMGGDDIAVRHLALTFNGKERVVQHLCVNIPLVPRTAAPLFCKLFYFTRRWLKMFPRTRAVIHCLDGAAWTGVFCAALNIFDQISSEGSFDMMGIVQNLRLRRDSFICNQRQYDLLFHLVKVFLSRPKQTESDSGIK